MGTNPGTKRRRRLTAIIGLLLIAMVILAAWSAVRFRHAQRQRLATAAVRRLGGWTFYNCRFDAAGAMAGTRPPGPLWLQRLVGPDFLGRVDVVTLAGDRPLDGFPDMSSLPAHAIEVTDSKLRPLQHLANLKWLALSGTHVSDQFMKETLPSLAQLQRLWLDDTRITDKGLQHLEHCRSLTHLWLDGTSVTDEGLAHIGKLTQLKSLSLQRTGVTDSGLAQLAPLRQIESLRLDGTSCTFAGVLHLFRDLQDHDLRASLRAGGYVKWSDGANILSLDLSHTGITDRQLAEIVPIKELQWLYLTDTAVTDEGLRQLAGLKELTLLDLSDNAVSDSGLQHLQALTKLRTLHLEQTEVTAEGVAAFRRAMPESLRIYW